MLLKWINIIGLLWLIFLQYQLWYGDNGLRAFNQLQQHLIEQSEHNATLENRNEVLSAEVENLKTGDEWLEAYARRDLGMIKQGETFFQMAQ
jgi:cell division protein FtsB